MSFDNKKKQLPFGLSRKSQIPNTAQRRVRWRGPKKQNSTVHHLLQWTNNRMKKKNIILLIDLHSIIQSNMNLMKEAKKKTVSVETPPPDKIIPCISKTPNIIGLIHEINAKMRPTIFSIRNYWFSACAVFLVFIFFFDCSDTQQANTNYGLRIHLDIWWILVFDYYVDLPINQTIYLPKPFLSETFFFCFCHLIIKAE